jgi:hypothetical protein
MQCIGKVASLGVQRQGVGDPRPRLHRNVRQPQQVVDDLDEFIGAEVRTPLTW